MLPMSFKFEKKLSFDGKVQQKVFYKSSTAHENQRNTNLVKHSDNSVPVHTLYPGPLWIPVVFCVFSESHEFILV